MAEELRQLRQASTSARQQEEDLLRLKQDLGEARRQIQSLQVRVEECNKQRKSRNMVLVREPSLYDSA